MGKRLSDIAVSPASTPWMRLDALLASHNEDILRQEERNPGHIYLYPLGSWWAAFEQSAWLLQGIFPDGDLSVLHLKAFPFPVVMMSISDRDYRSCPLVRALEASGSPAGPFCEVIPVPSQSSVADYPLWHRAVVDGTV